MAGRMIIEGWLRGAALIDGDSEGIDVGQSVAYDLPLGIELGWDDRCRHLPYSWLAGRLMHRQKRTSRGG